MKKTFEKLQNQHPHVRARVALTVAGSVTSVIAVVILTTLPLRFQADAASDGKNTAAVIGANDSAVEGQVPQNSWETISAGLQASQGTNGSVDESVAPQSTVVPGQDASQDANFPEGAARTNTESY